MAEFTDKISVYIEEAKARAADGLSVADLTTLTVDAVRLAIELLDRMDMPGADKKTEAVRVVEYFFDTFSDACIPLAVRPLWWIVRPAARALIISCAGGLVEALLPMVRS